MNKNILLLISLLLTACGSGGGSSSDAQGGPPAGTPAPVLTLTASQQSVDAGDSVTLNWNATDADGCTASGGWLGDRSISGNETITNLQNNQTFTLSCAGAGGGVMEEVVVQVNTPAGAPTVNFTADETIVQGNTSVELTWTTTDAQSCTASGAWSGDQPTAGSFTTPPLTQAATYTLTCDGASQSTVAMLSIQVVVQAVSWVAPTENTDDSALIDLAGYRVYYGDQPGVYSDNIEVGSQVTTLDLEQQLPQGIYYVAVTAFNIAGVESEHSNEVQRVIP